MPPYLRKKIWYADFRLTNPMTGASRRYRPSLGRGVTSKRMAVQHERELILRIEREWAKQMVEQGRVRRTAAFSGFAKFWYDTHVKVQLKPTTACRYEQHLRLDLVPWFKDTDMRRIESLDVEQWRAQFRATGKSPQTCNNALGVLSAMCSAAVRWHYADANPCTGVGRLKVPPRRMAFYTAEQTRLWLKVCRDTEPRWYPYMLCAFRTGMRQGELAGLRIVDLDFAFRRVHVRQSIAAHFTEPTSPKSGAARTIPMSADLAAVLEVCCLGRDDGFVFARPDGRSVNPTTVVKMFFRVSRRAGLHRIRPHDIRHSFASQLVMAGAPLMSVQKLLGHANIRSTMIYAHLADDFNVGVIELLTKTQTESGHSLDTKLEERCNDSVKAAE